jgi:hypothetical protein
VSALAGANDSVQGTPDPRCYNFADDPIKQFFENRILNREVGAQNWKEPGTLGLGERRGIAEKWWLPPLPPVFPRGIGDVKDLESIESTYFKVGGEVLCEKGFLTPVNQEIWTYTRIIEDMDCDVSREALCRVHGLERLHRLCRTTIVDHSLLFM